MNLLSSPSSSTTAFRLLYRGALSLPDSHLLLDGLSFFATAAGSELLDNPLALALESMRGRPSLLFMGQVRLADVYVDDSASVALDIHPQAMISRIFFENTFCLLPMGTLQSDIGVKVALGDTGMCSILYFVNLAGPFVDGPETTSIVIYARARPESPSVIRLCVSRITPPPPPPSVKRLPRPDDPTPRLPPPHFALGKPARVRELKRTASAANVGSKPPAKKAKSMTAVAQVKDAGKGLENIFKVPPVPLHDKGKGKALLGPEDDVFASQEPISDHSLESNKQLIKRCAFQHITAGIPPPVQLAPNTTPFPFRGCPPIPKSHPDHKELLGWVYRGVSYALRNSIKVRQLDSQLVDQLVRAHVQMYVVGA
ncbi:hypothetical protein HGRIS_001850 [Hohenbuehelia grisea]|uniref:Sld7 C-terminal domain-containing protein n=1 Tax=Hohenbuehelia grisea TaxID=104357 RepID=A0ABR3JKE4_9AGAR